MQELEQVLVDAESLALRLAEQAEQEAAMRQTLPHRFDINMACFRRYVPNIARRFDEYQVQRPFEFCCSSNGIPNLRWLDDGSVFYGEDPYAECLQQISAVLSDSSIIRFNLKPEQDWFGQQHLQFMNQLTEQHSAIRHSHELLQQIPESMPLGLMFGVGLGYQLGYLYERCELANLFIFEPNEDLFYASLFTFDWAPLLEHLMANNMGLHIFLGQSNDEIMMDLRDVVSKRAPFLCATTFGFVHYQSEVLHRLQAEVAREFFSLSMGWGFFDDTLFSLSHSLNNMQAGVPFFTWEPTLPREWQECPVFVIANGPSLDNSIELIRRYQDKALLIACGTAITSLHRAGIKPDIYMAVERVTVVPDSLRQLNDPDYLRDILLLGPDVLHPKCRDFFTDKIYAFKADEPMFSLLFANTEVLETYRKIAYVNPLVGNLGVSMPLHLGFNNLYLMGLDNGFRSTEHHHSRYSLYYNESGETRNEFKHMALAQGDSILPGNFGGDIISNRLFCGSVMMLEVAVKSHPEAQCHNCSDGAAIRGTTPVRPAEVDLSAVPVLDKPALRRFLLEEMAKPVVIERESVQAYMDDECFDMLLGRIRSEWQSMPTSRFALVQRMQTQMEYLDQIYRSRQRHIKDVLFGSFNSLFTLISHLAYSIEDEELALAAVGESLPIMHKFFDTMIVLYHHGLDMVQGPHRELWQFLDTGESTCG